jgi:phospholipid/cholesterol/gamma-HCH transport system substrate-binding protein
MNYSSAEIKSGILITASLTLFLVLTFAVGKFTGGKSRTWQVRFGYVSGLEKNAPVYFAGHEVGKVDRIEVTNGEERPILVTVRIPEKIELREDSEVFIDTLGLMGEKFVELTPGTGNSPLLNSEPLLQGTDPVPMYLLVQKMNLLADRMDVMTASLNPVVEQLNGVLKGQEEEISKMIANFHEASANIRDMTHELKFRPWRLVRKG